MINPNIVTLDSSTGLVTVSPQDLTDVGTYTIQFKTTIGNIVRTSDFILTVPKICAEIPCSGITLAPLTVILGSTETFAYDADPSRGYLTPLVSLTDY